jgi:hypothetical protein
MDSGENYKGRTSFLVLLGGFKSGQFIYVDYTCISLEKTKKPFTILTVNFLMRGPKKTLRKVAT